MSIFKPVTLGWNGKNYTIPANRILGAVATIEEVITLTELNRFYSKGAAPLAKLAMAYAAALEYAGVENKGDLADRVFDSMFDVPEVQEGKPAPQQLMTEAIVALLGMMVPPKHLQGNLKAVPPAARKTGGRSSSSKKRTSVS